MRITALGALFLLALAGLMVAGFPAAGLAAEAQTGSFATYRSYDDEPVASGVSLPAPLLAWLAESRGILGPEGFSFLVRQDESHWMGIALRDGILILQIHDESSNYNLRAIVGMRTGALTVLRGVDRWGTTRESDARNAATIALEYLERLRSGAGVFPASLGGARTTAATIAVTKSPPAAASTAAAPPAAAAPAAAAPKAAAPSAVAIPEEPWARLLAGNARFVAGTATHPSQDAARRGEVAKAQKPFAVIVTCSDSRLPPELLFDAGLGELFVVRTAGGVVTTVELGSVEYAVEHLGANFVLVLGHERCGAVEAAVTGGELPPNIEAIAALIGPAVEAARAKGGELLDGAVRANAVNVLGAVGNSRIVQAAATTKGLRIVAAYYDLDTGKVEKLK